LIYIVTLIVALKEKISYFQKNEHSDKCLDIKISNSTNDAIVDVGKRINELMSSICILQHQDCPSKIAQQVMGVIVNEYAGKCYHCPTIQQLESMVYRVRRKYFGDWENYILTPQVMFIDSNMPFLQRLLHFWNPKKNVMEKMVV
jgi:hypothetical protein